MLTVTTPISQPKANVAVPGEGRRYERYRFAYEDGTISLYDRAGRLALSLPVARLDLTDDRPWRYLAYDADGQQIAEITKPTGCGCSGPGIVEI